jgi:hypothetical protein
VQAKPSCRQNNRTSRTIAQAKPSNEASNETMEKASVLNQAFLKFAPSPARPSFGRPKPALGPARKPEVMALPG